MRMKRVLRAIDLYSGVGGWSFGLRLAGITVVASYERWGPANETNFKNNHHHAQTVDIRRLSFADLPTDIDIVVGSPPCTEFSFSNRGGSGNLQDGLEDIVTFLRIVDYLKPKFWAMENVPRVAPIIVKELMKGGRLHEFSGLGIQLHLVDMEMFGLPQRRKRCIVGDFSMALLQSYAPMQKRSTLGDVIAALTRNPVRDPLYGKCVPQALLVDHVLEAPLNPEECRINRANKVAHTVYNAMPFPDRTDRAVRTVTATCTRVSRESIVINCSDQLESVRRLTVRERACLQGFPITFQFYGATYAQKIKMVGNAVPPAFSYLVGHAFLGTAPKALPALRSHLKHLSAPAPLPITTPPDRPGSTYPANRTFRFAIESLRLKSGVRFELRNWIVGSYVDWSVDFYFGTSKSIIALPMEDTLRIRLLKMIPKGLRLEVEVLLSQVSAYIAEADIKNMQRVWSHRGVGGTRPFMLLDELHKAGNCLVRMLEAEPKNSMAIVDVAINAVFGADRPTTGLAKLARNAPLIATGLLIGSTANSVLRPRDRSASGSFPSVQLPRRNDPRL